MSSNQAGSHSDLEAQFRLKLDPTEESGGQHLPLGNLRDLAIQLPPGLVGSLARYPTCGTAVFVEQVSLMDPTVPTCPADSQVGLISPGVAGTLSFPPGAYRTPLYNLERPGGNQNVVARLGAVSLLFPMFIDIRLDPKRNDAITAELVNAPSLASITGSNMTMWGFPGDPSHDDERFSWLEALSCNGPCSGPTPSQGPKLPALSNPTSCDPSTTGTEVTSYAELDGGDAAFGPSQATGCERVPFSPTLSARASTRSTGSAAGIGVSLHVPQDGLASPQALRTADLREATVTLPEGVSLNPSVTDGLGTCSETQIGFDPNERQLVNLGAGGAPTSLEFGGQATAPLPQLATARQVQGALEALPNLDAGDVTVQGRPGGPWQMDFGGALRAVDVPSLTGVHSELQRLAVKAEGGTYVLGFAGESTVPLPHDADAATVQAALEGLAAIDPGDVEVRGEARADRAGFRIAFGGRLSGIDVPSVTATASLSGVGSFATLSELAQGGSPVAVETIEQGGSLRFDGEKPRCPEASKIASGTLTTPLLPEPLVTSVYLAEPDENPFNSRFAAYLVAAGDGVVLKVAGRFTADADTGQVAVSFANFPQLPIGSLDLAFKGGDRGLVTMPGACGTYVSTYDLMSWSGASAKGVSKFVVDERCDPGPNSAVLNAGSTNAVAGAFTSLLVQLVRGPGAPPLNRMAVGLPPGMVANLNGVTSCSDAALAGEGESRPGGAAAPPCPADSQIGIVTVGAGSGLPAYLPTGAVYLAGPYRGAPFSLALSVPAVLGPFDLGYLFVRAAVSVDPATAEVHAISDPFPKQVDGVPLQLRDVRILIDRPGFMTNPTSCDEKAFTGSIEDASGLTSPISDRFQVGDCGGLSFMPRLHVDLGGAIARNGHPVFRTVLRPRPGGANLASVALELPTTELLDEGHIRAVCDGTELAQGNCPVPSILGNATIKSPILPAPLHGPIFLRASSHPLPDLAADLHGPVDFLLDGRIGYAHRALSVSFTELPDIPVSKVVISLAGGPRGLLVNSESLCAGRPSAAARLTAQDGEARALRPPLRVDCGVRARRRGKRHRGERRPGAGMSCGLDPTAAGRRGLLTKRACG